MKKPPFIRHLSLAVMLTFLYGCNIEDIPDMDNLYLPDYKGHVALLLVKDTLVVNDFLEKVITDSSALSVGDNQEIVFMYETTTSFSTGEDFVQVESFENSKYIESPINFFYTPPADTTLRITQSVNFNFPSKKKEQIDSVFYSSGIFNLTFNSSFPGTFDYEFSTEAFNNIATGDPIFIEQTGLAAATTPPTVDNQQVPLEGYKTLLTTEGDSNKFEVQLDVSIHIPAGSPLSGNEYVYFGLAVQDPLFDAVFGNFGQDTFNISAKRISLGMFDDFTGTGIEFQNPVITLTADNSFGIQVGLDFSQAHAEYTDRDDMPVTGAIVDNLQMLQAPDAANYGTSVQTVVTADQSNSNLREILATSPSHLVLPLVGYSNLDGSVTNFLVSNSAIDVETVISLPLSVRLDAFEYESEVDVSSLDALDGTEELTLIFNTINELPFGGNIDLFFLDENGARFDSLVGTALFTAPVSYDGSGKVTAPAVSKTEITLDAGKITSLSSASSLTLVTRLNSHGYDQDEFVQVFADYKLVTALSVEGKLKYNLNKD